MLPSFDRPGVVISPIGRHLGHYLGALRRPRAAPRRRHRRLELSHPPRGAQMICYSPRSGSRCTLRALARVTFNKTVAAL